MRSAILRLFLLALPLLPSAGHTSLTRRTHPSSPAVAVETLRQTLRAADTLSRPVVLPASFDEAIDLIQNLRPQEITLDGENRLRFRYSDKWFQHADEGSGSEQSYILYERSADGRLAPVVRFTGRKRRND